MSYYRNGKREKTLKTSLQTVYIDIVLIISNLVLFFKFSIMCFAPPIAVNKNRFLQTDIVSFLETALSQAWLTELTVHSC